MLTALVWILPVAIAPWATEQWAPWFIARWVLIAAAVAYCGRPKHTWSSAVLAAVAVAETLRIPTVYAAMRGVVWASGFGLYACARGASPEERDRVRRWWWLGMVPVMGYAALQMWAPSWDPLSKWMLTAQTPSTLGGPHFLAEQLAPVVLAAPWPVALAAAGVMLRARSRWPLVGLALAAVIHRRWFVAVPLAVGFLVMVVFWRPDAVSGLVRLEVWSRTVRMIGAHPLTGVGTGNYMFAIDQAPLRWEPASLIASAHNEFLERAAEWGIPAGLVFLAWVAMLCLRSPVCTALACGALLGHSLHHPVGWALLCIMGGLDERTTGERSWGGLDPCRWAVAWVRRNRSLWRNTSMD